MAGAALGAVCAGSGARGPALEARRIALAGACAVFAYARPVRRFQLAFGEHVAWRERAAALADAGCGDLLRIVTHRAHARGMARARHAPHLLVGGIDTRFADAVV